MGREESNWKSICITIIITSLITPLIGLGVTQNVTELPENGTSVANVPEFNESQPENSTDIEPIITILSERGDVTNITPQLSAKKDSFALDEEPAFTFRYIRGSEKEFEAKESGIAAPGQKAFKRWRTANETIEAFVYDSSGTITDIAPEIELISDGEFSITVPRARAFRAGVYKLEVELVQDERIYVVEKEFPWGLVSLNTRKSIYKPGETAEFIIVVLDEEGHSVCDANISMIITNPNDEKTGYCTCAGTILPGDECGLYTANYTTKVEGNHLIEITALIGGFEVSFNTYFLVQQNYEFEIIRTAQSKIDPTRQNWFEVKIDTESFTDTSSITLKEFVPAEFDISADGATVLVEDDTKTIIWNRDLIENKASVRYSYAVPHIWPYLYALGPAEIDYDSKTFTEARPWYVAVDPAETRYMRGDTHDVNGLTAYILGTTQSATGLSNLIQRTGAGGDTVNWGIRVWKRDSGSVETEITAGTPVATVSRQLSKTGTEEGIQSNNTWTSPQTSLNITDAIVVRVYAEIVGQVAWTVQANFTTEQLDVSQLNSGTWTVYYYTKYETLTTGAPSGRYTRGTFCWGNSTYNSRIGSFSWTEGVPPTWYNQSQNVSKLHKGEAINLSARWTDNKGLKNATLAHNGTGTWQNVSTIALSGTENWSNFTLVTGLGWTPGIKGWKIYANDTSNNENVTDVMTFELWGWSNVTWISPPGGSSYTVGETITLTCLVRDANTSAPIENYPVHFYNRTDSTVTYDFGVNYTNSSGYAAMDWNTSGVAAIWYYPKGNITDNATLFYNVSAVHEKNTSIKLLSPALEIRNQAASQGITSINVSGSSGETILNPYNDVDGSGSAQNTSTTTPVVTIYNPPSSTNYRIWLKVEGGTGWEYIVKDEKFNITAEDTDPGEVSTWMSLRPGGSWGTFVDTGEMVDKGTHKDLYLAFVLKGSGAGAATISVLGEVA
jgi:hypothetical protein